jgi:hypothetical protein
LAAAAVTFAAAAALAPAAVTRSVRRVTYLMPLALIAILYLAPGFVRELGHRLLERPGARRVFARLLRAGALATFIFGMPVLVGITDAGLDFREALIVNVIFMAGAAVFVGFALDRVSEAMVREAFRNLPSTFAALAQGLPLLLIVLVFLGITTEVWQVSAALDRRHFFFLAGALAVVTVGFSALRSLQDVHHLRQFQGAGARSPTRRPSRTNRHVSSSRPWRLACSSQMRRTRSRCTCGRSSFSTPRF